MEQRYILNEKKHLHFIGIGGSGMFPLVEILHSEGFKISGSDNNESDIIKMVRALNIPVQMEQKAQNIQGADLIVYSAAILPDNEELLAAKNSGIPTIERSVLLGEITKRYSSCICVSGTHGKTTATSMLTEILLDAGKDPTMVIGGKLKSIDKYGRAGNSPIMTCEACEFVDTFLKLDPNIAVVLNIDCDHMDYFKTMENLKQSFYEFCSHADKAILYNGDDQNCRETLERVNNKRKISFGLSEKNDYYPRNISYSENLSILFDLYHQEDFIASLTVNVPGKHNILNAVAAAAAALEVGVEPDALAPGLNQFHGAGRRFEFLGKKNDIAIVDDYAHHPAEIRATLETAKELPFQRVWAVHQPFTYSRTKALLNDFASALSLADFTVLTEIMGGREKNHYDIFAKDLADKIEGAVSLATQEEAAAYVLEHAKPGDLVITMGCGDIYKAAKIMLYGEYC